MVSPVEGLRPVRAARCVRSTASHPGIETLVPSPTEVAMVLNSESRTLLTTAWLWPEPAAMAATSSVRLSDLSAMGVLLGRCAIKRPGRQAGPLGSVSADGVQARQPLVTYQEDFV